MFAFLRHRFGSFLCCIIVTSFLNEILIVGQVLEVVLAKPQTEKKPDATYPYTSVLPPAHAPLPSYGGFAANPYGSMTAALPVASNFQQVF